jgi:RNA polymerase sigma factor (sigma-70 family)
MARKTKIRLEDHIPLVRSIAGRYMQMFPHLARDIEAAGVLGLVEALRKFDGRKGSFSTYAYYWIRREVLRVVDKVYHTLPIVSLEELGTGLSLEDVMNHMYSRMPGAARFSSDTREIVENLFTGLIKLKPKRGRRDAQRWVEIVRRYYGIGRKPQTVTEIARDYKVSKQAISNLLRRTKILLKQVAKQQGVL